MQLQSYDTLLVQPMLQSVTVGASQLQQLHIRTKLSDDFHVVKVKHLVGKLLSYQCLLLSVRGC